MITAVDGTTNLKIEVDWTDVEYNEALRNFKVLNAIFNGLNKNMFRKINTCLEAKKA